MNLFHLPPHIPFLDAIAAAWLARSDDPLELSRGLILLPTRRAARSLAEAFLRVSDGRPLLLPRITALGALDEAPLALAGALDLPPAVEPMQRLAALTRLILAMNGADGAPATADRAWRLAGELATLMDEAERAEIDLAARLPDAADPAYATHWRRTLQFLHLVTAAWPAWLAENGLMNPAARQVALLNAQAAAWQADPSDEPVLIAGTTAGIPAVARLLRVVAGLPQGQVVLPALDMAMEEDAWADLHPPHPQAGLRRLLADLGATRGDVQAWPARSGECGAGECGVPERGVGEPGATPGDVRRRPASVGDRGDTKRSTPMRGGGSGAGQAPAAPMAKAPTPSAPGPHGQGEGPERRFDAFSRALLPAMALSEAAWRAPARQALSGVRRLTPADQQQEAAAIALVLRDAIQSPGRRAALVTPDRELAARVAAELLRCGIVADDSAGEAVSDSPPAVFLRLLTRAVAEDLAPVPLLALLKHPFAAAGLDPAACRAAVRDLELACLRGPRPAPGVTGLRVALAKMPPQPRATDLLQRLERCLEPALRIGSALQVSPAEALAALIEAAERLAATDSDPGPRRLWAGEEGEALATRLAAVRDALPVLPDQPRTTMPGLLDAVLEGAAVRSRRALRGRADQREHPRVFIWGLLEARLQSPDVLVLAGLVEGVWPPATDPGPWLSRPMRATVGLPSPEEIVSQAAHDFVSAACSACEVVLSCPVRRDGAPSVPARWLTRLDMMLAGQGASLPEHPAAAWVRVMDQPADGPRPVTPPRPCPPLPLRPRRLSVTEIETWLRDPYAIYARHILRLQALRPLDEETDAADYGTLVHAGLNLFLQKHGNRWPPNAADGTPRGAGPRADGGAAASGPRRLVGAAAGPHRRLGGGGGDRAPCHAPAGVDHAGGEGRLDPAPRRRRVPPGRPRRPDRAPSRRRAGDPGLQDRHAAVAEGGGRRPGAAVAAGSGDGRGRRVRPRPARGGGGAQLLAPDRRVRAGGGAVAVQGRRSGDRRGHAGGARQPGRADRYL